MQIEKVQRIFLRSKKLCNRHVTMFSACGRKHLSSDNKSGQTGDHEGPGSTFREKMIKKHFYPSEEEVETLLKRFPDPKKVIDDLFAPFKCVGDNLVPKLDVKKQLRDSISKSRLRLSWPGETDVCGVHEDEDTSVLNAYLSACNLFQNMGLVKLSETGIETGVYNASHVIEILEELAAFQSGISGQVSNNFRVVNLLQHNQDDEVSWDSSLQVLWPLCFTVNSQSTCLDLAYYQTCLKAVMKLKAFGYLDHKNQLRKGILLALSRLDSVNMKLQIKDLSNPDFELFVDASNHGMGAYLISQDEEKIRWLSDRWIPEKQIFNVEVNSNMAEFYAFVTALYTWKHKFAGKKVLCYSDNMYVVNAINHGYYLTKMSKTPSTFVRLYMLLMKVCEKHNITALGLHVPRIQNVAADFLSRCDVESFKKIVPTAFEKPKKSKKLWFCHSNNKDKKNSKDNNDKNDEDPGKHR